METAKLFKLDTIKSKKFNVSQSLICINTFYPPNNMRNFNEEQINKLAQQYITSKEHFLEWRDVDGSEYTFGLDDNNNIDCIQIKL